MSGARKFDTFSGVFTPSILTILGVIMYLRLPAIVGQGGLATTIGIILIAHVISVTTGLSVASVATDRKVRGGGTYYMLSRSLGLPIGGTLGIALFVGLSFAVSLYIIGFAESFLSVVGMEATKNAIRVTGASVLALVAVVTLVSTSLALRAQFFILAAIVLSLASIFLGVLRPDATAAAPPVDAMAGAVPFILLFGIFFPAVTGFEAGVSMSGDLRDPKKSIPIGTIAAIAVGLVVYLILAMFLARTVDATQLATNPRILLDISLFPPLVLAGVWGATISSALGSVLAAPRILQAVSVDRITPAVFARGYGRDGEPRHALLLTVAIAATGIMIAELDAIARIVSMFFITAYGFLNIACAIESWASPDFRPSFRVPRAVPVAGALACLIVMIQLDFIALIGATLVLGALYFYLTRRQLQLDAGDAWSGFWASVARAALHRLDRSPEHRRNWRPNVLAFTLPGTPREPLLELGRELAGRRGMLTAVDLVTDDGAARAPPPAQTDTYGVFRRVIASADPYRSLPDIARYHGFAGVEPNALLLEWPEHVDARFDALLGRLAGLDQSVLLLASRASRAARPAQVDVWWWGEPSGALLQLSLLRALSSNDAWRGARLRVLTTTDASAGAGVTRRMAALLEDMRIEADVQALRVADSAADDELIARHSADADLVLIDAARFTDGTRALHSERLHGLRSQLKAAVFVLPSSRFAGEAVARAVMHDHRTPPALTPRHAGAAPQERAVLPLPADATLAEAVTHAASALENVITHSIAPLDDAYAGTTALVERAHAAAEAALRAAAAADTGKLAASRSLRRITGDLLSLSAQLFDDHRERVVADQAAALSEFTERLLRGVHDLPEGFERSARVPQDRGRFASAPGDDISLRAYKVYRRLISVGRRRVTAAVPLRDLVRRHMNDAVPAAEWAGSEFVAAASSGVADAQTLLAETRAALEALAAAPSGTQPELAASALRSHQERASRLVAQHRSAPGRIRADAAERVHVLARRLARDMERVDASRRARITAALRRSAETATRRARDLPGVWAESQKLLIAGAELDLALHALRHRIKSIAGRQREQLQERIANDLCGRLRALRNALVSTLDARSARGGKDLASFLERWPEFDADVVIDALMAELHAATADLPERVVILSPSSSNRLMDGVIDDLETVSIALRPLAEYYLDAEFLGPLQQRLSAAPAVYALTTDVARDAIRLAAFRFADNDVAREDMMAGAAGMLDSALRRIDNSIAQLEALSADVDGFIADRLEHTLDALGPYRMLQDTNRLPQFIRARYGREAASWFRDRHERLRQFAGEQTVRLLYQRSEATRYARELDARARSGPNALLELVASVTPDPAVLERVPFHYRQLFLGKPRLSREFWTGWATERRLAAAAVAHFRRGFGGPILVLGTPFAGKSSLARTIAEDHFPDAPLFRIAPPAERTTRPESMLSRIAESVSAPAGAVDPFVTIPAGSVVLLEDLDMWWERDTDGYGALETVLELMEQHANRCLFIVSADSHAFRFIDRVRPLRRRFLAVIDCRPFSAREISDVVDLRHGSSGLRFEVDGVTEDRLPDIARARLFHQLFEYSRGNVGTALHGWIAHIAAVEDDRIVMTRPVRPDLQPLDELDVVHKLLLVQLLLHRALPPARLVQLGGADPARLRAPLADLRRAHAVIDDPQLGLIINPYLRTFVAQRFTELELIE